MDVSDSHSGRHDLARTDTKARLKNPVGKRGCALM